MVMSLAIRREYLVKKNDKELSYLPHAILGKVDLVST